MTKFYSHAISRILIWLEQKNKNNVKIKLFSTIRWRTRSFLNKIIIIIKLCILQLLLYFLLLFSHMPVNASLFLIFRIEICERSVVLNFISQVFVIMHLYWIYDAIFHKRTFSIIRKKCTSNFIPSYLTKYFIFDFQSP